MSHRTIRAWGRAAVAAAALAFVPLLGQGTAHADQLWFADSTHDIVKTDLLSDDLALVPDPGTRNADIRSVFVHYRKGHLVLRANFVDLRRNPDAVIGLTGDIRTNEHRHYTYDVETSPGRYLGHDMLESWRGRSCEIGHLLNYRENFARISISLRCLSRPRWVQIRMAALSITFPKDFWESDDFKEGDVFLHLDDALSDTTDFTHWTPQVARG